MEITEPGGVPLAPFVALDTNPTVGSMIRHAMVMEKVSLTLDAKAVKEARRRAGKRGLSAYVDESLKLRLQHDRIRAWLDEAEQIAGPIPDEIREEVRREWEAGRRKRRRKSS
jgi:hypothetical protein